MASLNRITLLGNLTRDPEIKYVGAGTAVAKFGLAVNRRFRVGYENKEEVCFIDITVFGRQAETVSEYLTKGSMALIDGRLSFNQWETSDGQKRSRHEVVADNVQFMPKSGGQERQTFKSSIPTDDDDIPF